MADRFNGLNTQSEVRRIDHLWIKGRVSRSSWSDQLRDVMADIIMTRAGFCRRQGGQEALLSKQTPVELGILWLIHATKGNLKSLGLTGA